MSLLDKIKKNIKAEQEKEIQQALIEEEIEKEIIGDYPNYSLFDFVDCLTINKVKWEDLGPKNQKKLQVFMLNKVFSMIPEFSQVLCEFQLFQKNMTTEMVYKFWYYLLPKERFPYKYIKETPKEKIHPEIVKILKEYFEESEKNVIKYYNLLNYDNKVEILKKFGYNENKIEKLINGND